MSTLENFKKRLAYEGYKLTDSQIDRFQRYRELIIEWNQRIDITAITDDREIDEKHFIDSLSLTRYIPSSEKLKVVDIGTGGGFPGIPLKIVYDNLELCLVDSLNKRIEFLSQVVKALELENVEPIHARAEDIFTKKEYREAFDIAFSRAVAPLPTLLEYCLPAVKVGGRFYAMKGPAAHEEIGLARPAFDALGGKIVQVHEFSLTESNYQRTIIEIEKIRRTPVRYPRGQGKPRKDPLTL